MTSNPVYSIILVDDHPLFRKGVAQLVEDDSNFSLVGEASNARDGMALVEALDPDVILMDLNMKEMNGIEALTELRQRGVAAVIVIFTVSNHEKDILAAMKAGADGYLLKDFLDLLAACKSNKVIANELGITDGTVKVHVKNLLRKLNLKSRIEAAVWALENPDNDNT